MPACVDPPKQIAAAPLFLDHVAVDTGSVAKFVFLNFCDLSKRCAGRKTWQNLGVGVLKGCPSAPSGIFEDEEVVNFADFPK